MEQVGITFDERGFGFVYGHGELEQSVVGRGKEAPSGGIATWVSMAVKALPYTILCTPQRVSTGHLN